MTDRATRSELAQALAKATPQHGQQLVKLLEAQEILHPDYR
jgi:hypothetical protein